MCWDWSVVSVCYHTIHAPLQQSVVTSQSEAYGPIRAWRADKGQSESYKVIREQMIGIGPRSNANHMQIHTRTCTHAHTQTHTAQYDTILYCFIEHRFLSLKKIYILKTVMYFVAFTKPSTIYTVYFIHPFHITAVPTCNLYCQGVLSSRKNFPSVSSKFVIVSDNENVKQ